MTINLYNHIDYLILNAGINAHFEFSTLKNMNVFHDLMRVNFYANVYLMKYALN
jgi:short-subunit dehydrogenase involved in D-alanine esterification of teichoic acids